MPLNIGALLKINFMENKGFSKNELSLRKLRAEIDALDGDIAAMLKKRFCVCEKIKKVKLSAGLAIEDSSRESAVNEHIAALFENQKQKNAALNVYKSIIKECKALQTEE